MDVATMAREAPWMVPALLAVGIALFGAIVWLLLYIGRMYRESMNERMSKQDGVLDALGRDVYAIREMFASELRRFGDRLSDHNYRIRRLEDHNHLPPMRRYDDQEAGD